MIHRIELRHAWLPYAATGLLAVVSACKVEDKGIPNHAAANGNAPSEQVSPDPIAPGPEGSVEAPRPILLFEQWAPHEVGMDDWMQIVSLLPDHGAGWATGRPNRKENRLEIETEGVARIKLDLARLDLDWSRRVWIRIDDQSAELVRGSSSIKELQRSDAGRWIPARGNEPATGKQ